MKTCSDVQSTTPAAGSLGHGEGAVPQTHVTAMDPFNSSYFALNSQLPVISAGGLWDYSHSFVSPKYKAD